MFDKNVEYRDPETVELFKRMNIPYHHYVQYGQVSSLAGSCDFIDHYLKSKKDEDKNFLLQLYNYIDFKRGFNFFNSNLQLARAAYYVQLRILQKLDFQVLNLNLKDLAGVLSKEGNKFNQRFNDAEVLGIDDFFISGGDKDYLSSNERYSIVTYLRFALSSEKAFLFCGSTKKIDTASIYWGADLIDGIKSVNKNIGFVRG